MYQRFRANLTSPGSVDSRLTGFVEADYLFSKIQANREDFFDNALIDKICDQLEPNVQSLINDFLLLKSYASEYAYLNQFNLDREDALNRIKNIHQDLEKIGSRFKYEPTCEQEVVVIISELIQLGMLDFEIIKISSRSHIDCLVQWSIKQTQRMPEFVGHLEIETELHKFFAHQHDYRTKPEICCWKIDIRKLENEFERYKSSRPESIESIEINDPTPENKKHFNHQKEIYVKIKLEHNEFALKVLRVYSLIDIISEKAKTINTTKA